MLSASTPLRFALLIPLLTITSCALRTSSESEAFTVGPSDVTGSWCSAKEPADEVRQADGEATEGVESADVAERGSLCVNLTEQSGSIDAFGLADGSELVVTGSRGDVVTFDIDGAGLSAQLEREMVEDGFDVKGVWASGEDLQLVVEQS